MILACDNVSIRFGHRWVLARLSFAIRRGQTVLLTGDNGAGKTTLLRAMATALRPTRGVMTLFDEPNPDSLPAVRARLGLMTHQHYLYEGLTARENLALICRLTRRARADDVDALLRYVNLAQHAQVSVSTFSAGMKRRLALARLLLLRPELVLLDEPFGQLDPKGVDMVATLIGDLQRAGVTQVISTHDIARGEALADATLHLADGTAARRQNLEECP